MMVLYETTAPLSGDWRHISRKHTSTVVAEPDFKIRLLRKYFVTRTNTISSQILDSAWCAALGPNFRTELKGLLS